MGKISCECLVWAIDRVSVFRLRVSHTAGQCECSGRIFLWAVSVSKGRWVLSFKKGNSLGCVSSSLNHSQREIVRLLMALIGLSGYGSV